MLNLFPNADDQEMRSFLGRFQIQGTEALKPMFLLVSTISYYISEAAWFDLVYSFLAYSLYSSREGKNPVLRLPLSRIKNLMSLLWTSK